MTDDELVTNFDELFEGNRGAWGAVHGEAVRAPLTRKLLEDHLFGFGSVGVYPLVVVGDGAVVHWGCTDIDTHGSRGLDNSEARVHAHNLKSALQVMGITAWIELTKSHGYHVWVFSEEWVPAEWMRNTLLVAHQIAEVPVVEVNPKQVSLDSLVLGNYVNLPYAHSWSTSAMPTRVVWRMADEGGGVYMVEQFVDRALDLRTPPAVLHETAKLYVPPPPRAAVALGVEAAPQAGDCPWTHHDIEDDFLRVACSKLDGRGWTIFRDGPLPGEGRGFTLFKLALSARDNGLTPDEAFVVLVDADWRWCKYMRGLDGHKDGVKYIEKMVQDVYG